MNEEIEYAQMLEIPVSTINLVKKKKRAKKTKTDLKEDLIARVNERMQYAPPEMAAAQADERILQEQAARQTPTQASETAQTPPVFVISDEDAPATASETFTISLENAPKMERKKPLKLTSEHVLTAEFAAACVLCGGIFLTNVFMPNSAINTFFRSFSGGQSAVAEKNYYEFDMQSVLGEITQGEIELSPTGVLTVKAKGCIYPALDGNVTSVTEVDGGAWEMRVGYTDEFYGVISGLDEVYYKAGDRVRSNIPVGYSDGNGSITVSLYSGGALLNCFTLDENGCPVWNENAP